MSVSATWRTHEGLPGFADINLTVTAARSAEGLGAALGAAFVDTLAAQSPSDPAIHISFGETAPGVTAVDSEVLVTAPEG